MKYYIIAGESSGDLHGSNLMRAILKKDQKAVFKYWGGDEMQSVSLGIVKHIRETNIMGFIEVAKRIGSIRGFFKLAKQSISDFGPDVVIFIDYPGFNLRMAKWVNKHGYKTVFYISPQLWAWKSGRKKQIKKYIDKLLVILPFERDWYSKEGIEAIYVGHPLIEAIKQKSVTRKEAPDKKTLLLLPGSRMQEISKLLPIMVEGVRTFADKYVIKVVASQHISDSEYEAILDDTPDVILSRLGTYNLLQQADIAVVTSGTATLETAILDVPQVVCYKTSRLNYAIGRKLIDLKYISLVNLILDKEAVAELIQDDCNPESIRESVASALTKSTEIKKEYKKLRDKLQTEKYASDHAAEVVVNLLK